jgi:hypothetical protein
MIHPTTRLALVVLALLLTTHTFADAPPPAPTDAKPLFDGKTLTGWDGDPRLWSVKDGVIRGETNDTDKKAKGNTFLILKDQTFADFDLRLSFRCNASNNSGIQYRSQRIEDPRNKDNHWIMKGYQHEIRNEKKLPSVTGFIYDERGKRGRIVLVGEKATWENGKKNVTAQILDQAGFEKAMKIDDWNEVVIIARGNHIQHFLNGVQLIDFTDNDPQLALKSGLLALQLHAGKPMWAEFKDIRIKELK